MGRHSSDESEHSRGGRKKRRSRSVSYDRSESRERKSRKKSRKHLSPSRSKRQRSRSSSYEKSRRSRSGSRRKTRRSHSRSTETSRHSSVSHGSKHKGSRRSQSGSRSYSRSKHDHSGSKSSKSRRKSRNRDRSHSPDSNDSSSVSSFKPTSLKSQQSASSLDYLTSAEKAEARLQMALKAAAAADEQLKRKGLLASNAGRPLISTEDQQKRANAIEEIDGEGFAQSTFRSTRSEIPMPKGSKADASHAGAMFGSSASSTFFDSIKTSDGTVVKASVIEDDNLLMHPNMYLLSAEEKLERWKLKIVEIRKKILKETGGVIP